MGKSSDSAAAARLASTVSVLEDPGKRMDALAKFITGYKPERIVPVLDLLVADTCTNPEAGLSFLALMDLGELARREPNWNWSALQDHFVKTKMEEVWKVFGRLTPSEKEAATAKISMLIEIFHLLIEDELLDPETDMECTGPHMAARVLEKGNVSDPNFVVKLASYPVSVRKFLKDILSELDFIEKTPGSWYFTMFKDLLKKYASGANIAAHLGTGKISAAVAQRMAENLVKRLDLLLKALQMFPSGHPSIDPAADAFLTVLTKLMGEKDQVTLSILGGTIMVNDVKVESRNRSILGFVRSFNERQMSSLTFSGEISPDEIKTFAKLFNRPPAYILEHGGMGKLLESRSIDSISVNRFHYKLISEDGDSEDTLVRGEVTIEDAIFSELIDRLERGEGIDSIPGSKIGDALKSVLAAAKENKEEQRAMIARFVLALDPSLLESGLLSNKAVQRSMAWKVVRKMLDRLLVDLNSPDPDIRHESLGRLLDMAGVSIRRGKENSTIQIIESVSIMLKREKDPDVLYRGITLIASMMEMLMKRGMMSLALETGKVLLDFEAKRFPRTEMETARKRALLEASRKMDTMESAEALVEKLLSEDEVVAREARKLAMIAPPDNLVSRLAAVFHDDNRRMRSKAFQMLVKMGARGLSAMHSKLKETAAAFKPYMNDKTFTIPDKDWYVSRNIIQVLREIGSQESGIVLAELCMVPDPRIRRECLLALMKVAPATAESLAMQLVFDDSPDVAGIAVDMLSKQARKKPVFVSRLVEAFTKNPGIRHDLMKTFLSLGNNREIMHLIRIHLNEGPAGLLFEDPYLLDGALKLMRKHGKTGDLPILENIRDEVAGGLFKKSRIDRNLLAALRDTIEFLRTTPDEPASPPRTRKRVKKVSDKPNLPAGDDEITILGPDFGINND